MKLKQSLIKLKKQKKKLHREKLIQETNEYTYGFKNFQSIKAFGRDIYEGKITINVADEHQKDLLVQIMNLRENTRTKSQGKKKKKKLFLKTCIIFWGGRGKFLTLLKAKYFYQNLSVQAF